MNYSGESRRALRHARIAAVFRRTHEWITRRSLRYRRKYEHRHGFAASVRDRDLEPIDYE